MQRVSTGFSIFTGMVKRMVMWQNAAAGLNKGERNRYEYEKFEVCYVRSNDGGGYVSLLFGNEEAKKV